MDKQHNFKPVAEIIATIKSELEKQTQAWKAIGAELYELKSTYGFQSDEAQAVIEATGWDKSTISKLAKIGGDSRLSDPLFKSVDAWSVLYEVTCLNDIQLDQLKSKLIEEPKLKLTSALISSIRNPETDPNVVMEAIRTAAKVTRSPVETRDGILRIPNRSKTVVIDIDLSNHIECDINLEDATVLLKVYDALKDPQVTFSADEIVVCDAESGFRYITPNNTGDGWTRFIEKPLPYEKEAPKVSIDRSTFSRILKMSSMTLCGYLLISANGERVRGILFDTIEERTRDLFEFDLGETESTFEVVLTTKNISYLMEGDYVVSIDPTRFSRWERANTDYDPVYAAAFEPVEGRLQTRIDQILGRETETEEEELQIAA